MGGWPAAWPLAEVGRAAAWWRDALASSCTARPCPPSQAAKACCCASRCSASGGSRSADQPAGVGPGEVRLGTVLPLSGPGAAAGQQVLAGLQAVLAQVNAVGGVHGRQLRLLAVDGAADGAHEAGATSTANGPNHSVSINATALRARPELQPPEAGKPRRDPSPAAARVHAALQSLWAQPVYALVGGVWDEDQAQVEPWLAAAQWPHIGALVRRSQPVGALGWSAAVPAWRK